MSDLMSINIPGAEDYAFPDGIGDSPDRLEEKGSNLLREPAAELPTIESAKIKELTPEELEPILKEKLEKAYPVFEKLEKINVPFALSQSFAFGLQGVLNREPGDLDIIIPREYIHIVEDEFREFGLRIIKREHEKFASTAVGSIESEKFGGIDFIAEYAFKARDGEGERLIVAGLTKDGDPLPGLELEEIVIRNLQLPDGRIIDELKLNYFPSSMAMLVKYV